LFNINICNFDFFYSQGKADDFINNDNKFLKCAISRRALSVSFSPGKYVYPQYVFLQRKQNIITELSRAAGEKRNMPIEK